MTSQEFVRLMHSGDEESAVSFFQSDYENRFKLLGHVISGSFDSVLWRILDKQKPESKKELLSAALRSAISWGRMILAGKLLRAGAYPGPSGYDGKSVWHSFSSVFCGNTDATVDMLVSNGAHIFLTCPDHRGRVPSEISVQLFSDKRISELHEKFGRPPGWAQSRAPVS
jgi:hypothetical protein